MSSANTAFPYLASNLYYNVFGGNPNLPLEFDFILGVRWLLGLLGFLLNASLVFVTWRTKTLRESCNLLIGANALFAGLFGLSLCIGWALVLSGHSFTDLWTCFLLQAFPLLCRNVGLNTLLFIGIDRIICVQRPGWNRQSPAYLGCICCASAAHALFIVVACLRMAWTLPDLPVLCSTHDDVYQGSLTTLLFAVNVALSTGILVCYLYLWALLKWRKSSASVLYTRKIIRSLMAMMGLLVAGFLVNNVMQLVYLLAEFSPSAKAYISVVLAWLPAAAYASNALILVAFSVEYRRAYETVFGLHFLKSAPSLTQSVPLASINPMTGATAKVGDLAAQKQPQQRQSLVHAAAPAAQFGGKTIRVKSAGHQPQQHRGARRESRVLALIDS